MRHPIVYEYVTSAEVNILLKKKKRFVTRDVTGTLKMNLKKKIVHKYVHRMQLLK